MIALVLAPFFVHLEMLFTFFDCKFQHSAKLYP